MNGMCGPEIVPPLQGLNVLGTMSPGTLPWAARIGAFSARCAALTGLERFGDRGSQGVALGYHVARFQRAGVRQAVHPNRQAGDVNRQADRVNRQADRVNRQADRVNRQAGRINRQTARVNCQASRINCQASRINRQAGDVNRQAGRGNRQGARANCENARANFHAISAKLTRLVPAPKAQNKIAQGNALGLGSQRFIQP